MFPRISIVTTISLRKALLSERDGNPITPTPFTGIGFWTLRKALLSERDGNQLFLCKNFLCMPCPLGRHYSLKEMETHTYHEKHLISLTFP